MNLRYDALPGELIDDIDSNEWEEAMHDACAACGIQGTWDDFSAASEQRGAGGVGWDSLSECRDRRACERRLLALLADDAQPARTVPPGSTTAHAA